MLNKRYADRFQVYTYTDNKYSSEKVCFHIKQYFLAYAIEVHAHFCCA